MERIKNFSISKIKPWIKLLLILCALFIAYLFALNGRYTKLNADYAIFFDKWTNKIIIKDSEIEKAFKAIP